MAIAEPIVVEARPPQFDEMAVWHEWPLDRSELDGYRHQWRPNVGPADRVASVLGGGALAAYGLSRRSIPGTALALLGGYLMARGVSGRCPVYRALRISTAQEGRAEPVDFFERGIHVTKSITINAPQQKLYEFWRDLANLPRVMEHLKSVEIIDDRRSHWIAKGPLNSSIEWDAEIINDEPYESLAWRSLDDAEVDNAGSVRFVPAFGNRGTQVKVNIAYLPKAGKLATAVAKMFGQEPNQQVREDLRRFKQLMEAR
jgi:uncharacterized membrane protein